MKPVVALLAAAILLSGCTQTTPATPPANQPAQDLPTAAEPTPDNAKQFAISITHSKGYQPREFTVTKGDTVRFLATSDPVSHRHGLTIEDFGVNAEVAAGPNDPPQAVEFVADKAGDFPIWCKTCVEGPEGSHPWIRGTLFVKGN
ncbi:MAG: hypothetical protein HY519_00640 [Candidatus Aenigmarchaeota archaeon]|nr:hypothetical protein [Candidatus Aenigmarchaeota archaeon]